MLPWQGCSIDPLCVCVASTVGGYEGGQLALVLASDCCKNNPGCSAVSQSVMIRACCLLPV